MTLRALLVAGVLLLPAPAAAAPPACSEGPLELATSRTAGLTAGDEHVQGYVLRRLLGGGRTCVLPGATVELLARTANSTDTRVVRTGSTDADGRVTFTVRPPHTTALTARVSARAVTSAESVVRVRTRISLATRRIDSCRVRAAGRTYPAKPGTTVEVTGGPHVVRTRIGADGTYAAVVPVTCGSSPRLISFVGGTYRNDFGRSDLPEPVASPVVTCGTESAAPGPAQPGLTLALELFNTVTEVGGAWYGEVVIGNPTSEPVSVRPEDSFRVGEPYRILRASDVLGLERWTDAGEPPRTLTLQPGEERRRPVVVAAANCMRSSPQPAFESSFGRPLPPGAYEAVAVKTVDGGRRWSSARVAVRVAD